MEIFNPFWSARSICNSASASLQCFDIFSTLISHPLAGLETQVRAPRVYAALALSTGKDCGCLQRSPPEEGFPELGTERTVGESAPVLLPPAVLGGRAGQPRTRAICPEEVGATATDLRFWSKASSHLPSFSEGGLCVLDEMTPITHLIDSPLFLTLIETTL